MSESFANKPPSNPDKDTFYTMGGLENLPTQEPAPVATAAPGFDLGQFIGSAEQLGQLYPGIQNRPEYDPGLSDIRYTRSFGGLGEPGSSFYSPSGAGNAPAPFQEQIVYQQPILQPQDQAASNEALLSGLLGMDWSGAYQDYLNKLQAQSQDISISNVFTPTNVNYQTQTQRQQQQQSMNGTGQSQEQDSDDDSQDDDFSLDDILSGINLGGDTDSDITDGALDSDFFTDTTTGGGNFVDNITLDDLYQDTIKGGNFNDTINLDDIFEGTDTTGGGNYVDTIVDTTKGTIKTDTVKGGNGNDFLNPDDTIIDFEIGRPDTVDGGTKTDTTQGGNGVDTLEGGNNNDNINTGETPAEREARLAREQEERDRLAREQEERDRLAREQAERDRLAAEQAERDRLAREQAERDAKADRENTVKQAYEAVFGRSDVDQEGLDYWAGQLEGGKSSTDLLRDLVSGAQGADVEAVQNTDTVSKLYENLLGRAPDAEGLSYYRSQLAAGATPEDVARNLISGAKAGSESSEISQAEYERYFPTERQEDTQQPTTGATSNAVNNVFNITGKDIETANELAQYATNFLSNQDLDPRFFSDAIRENFISDVATNRPDLLGSIVYDPKYATIGDEGVAGIDTQQLTRDLSSALESEGYAELASLLGETSGLAGDFAGPIGDIVSGVLQGDNLSEIGGSIVATLAVNAAIDMGAVALASLGIPGAGPFIAAGLALDAVLSKALGYDSPIQDGISFIADMTEKGLDELQKMFGGAFESIGDFFSGIGGIFGGLFAEGGLVDLPGDSMYNDNTQGVLPDIESYARGGIIPLPGGGKIAKGPGGGLDDLIPTSIDGRRAAALSDGEFVIPADVVSMMGDGSTNAGSKRLYDMVRQVRQEKTGTSRQAGPLQVGKILERTM